LRDLNEHMDKECRCSQARYGILLDASLITGIDPPSKVESALAAINTAHDQVSSDISVATAAADQRIVESKCAVEIETLKAEADVEPLQRMAAHRTYGAQTERQGGDGCIRAERRTGALHPREAHHCGGEAMNPTLLTALVSFVAFLVGVPLALGVARSLGTVSGVLSGRTRLGDARIENVENEPPSTRPDRTRQNISSGVLRLIFLGAGGFRGQTVPPPQSSRPHSVCRPPKPEEAARGARSVPAAVMGLSAQPRSWYGEGWSNGILVRK
jgi:hypothetical protein